MTDAIEEHSLTIVLGAGASFEVGMPVGSTLKDQIASALNLKFDDFGRLSSKTHQTVAHAAISLAHDGVHTKDPNECAKVAKLICNSMPLTPSIDNFIDSHRENKLVAAIGKLAIAYNILRAERSSLLHFSSDNTYNTIDFDKVGNTWYVKLFQLLTQNTQADQLATRLQKIKVVTFNYDRTLEHFMFHAIRMFYSLSKEKTTEILESLTIYHPYGRVGRLPWQIRNDGVKYGAELNIDELKHVSSQLLTFTEGTSLAYSDVLEIRSTILNANRLLFLGFAYHKLNLDLLYDDKAPLPGNVAKKVWGTSFNFSKSDSEEARADVARLSRCPDRNVQMRNDLTAVQMMQEYSRTLFI